MSTWISIVHNNELRHEFSSMLVQHLPQHKQRIRPPSRDTGHLLVSNSNCGSCHNQSQAVMDESIAPEVRQSAYLTVWC